MIAVEEDMGLRIDLLDSGVSHLATLREINPLPFHHRHRLPDWRLLECSTRRLST
jgi:hypothetical protein